MIKHLLESVPTWVPFLGMIVNKGELHTPFVTRIVEVLLIPVITAGIVLYGVTMKQDEQIKSVKEQMILQIAPLKEDIADIKGEQKSIRKGLNDLSLEVARSNK